MLEPTTAEVIGDPHLSTDASSSSTRWLPMNEAPPVTNTLRPPYESIFT